MLVLTIYIRQIQIFKHMERNAIFFHLLETSTIAKLLYKKKKVNLLNLA